MTPEIVSELRNILATLYVEELSIRRVVADAGLSATRLKFGAAVIDIWHFVLSEAENVGRMESLLIVVESEYGSNSDLQRACTHYREAAREPRAAIVDMTEAIGQQKIQPDPQPATVPVRLYPPIINHDGAIQQFRQLLRPEAQHRFIHLKGEGEMGKTTLVAKVFPILAEHLGVAYAAIDMRNAAQSPIELMDVLCNQLGYEHFPHFEQAYSDLLSQQHASVQINRGVALFSRVEITNRQGEDSKGDLVIPNLTRNFVDDLRRLNEQLIVLLFDTVDQASVTTQNWLLNDLLGRLRPLLHLRVVVAGRRLPDAASSYSAACRPYSLSPVFDEDAYVRYCHEIGVRLDEQSIRLLAKNTGYIPGAFANTAKLFVPQGLNND